MEAALKHLEQKYSYSKEVAPEENYLISIEALRIARNEAFGDALELIGNLDKFFYSCSPDSQSRCVDLYDLIDKIKAKIV